MSIEDIELHLSKLKKEIIFKSIFLIFLSLYFLNQFTMNNNIYSIAVSFCVMFYGGWITNQSCAKYSMIEDLLQKMMKEEIKIDSVK